jgi:hypothetical protein
LGIGNSCLGRKPEFGADYRHARPRRKPGFGVQLPSERRLEDLYNKWFLRRLPTGEALNLPMSPQLAEIFRVLGAPE